jgi:ribosomal protein L22
VNGTVADRTLSIRECIHQANNARRKFKDVLNKAKTNGSFYELEVATARVEKRFPHLTEDDESRAIEREDIIQHELKSRENKRTSQKTFWKLGRKTTRASKAKFSQEIKLVKSNSTRDGWHMDTDYW